MDDSISRQAAIDSFPEDALAWDIFDGYVAPHYVRKILETLPSAEPEQTDCEYCHEDIDGCVMPIEKNGHAFVRFGMNGWELCLQAKGWHGGAKIRFCPMCGRRLER